MNATHGLVTDTITFSSVDGPGNRFVVFLQGCNFDCITCHNPYTISICHNCGECVTACPSGALVFSPLGALEWSRDACHGADACIDACPWDANPKAMVRPVWELLADIRAAAPFLSGVTASGGEATQQADFVRELFSTVKSDPATAHLTCFVDSNGAAEHATWTLLLPVMDAAMIDLKCLDPDIHRRLTGQSNEKVLESIRYLAAVDKLYEVRLLLVPGVNDDPALLDRTASWLADMDPTMRIKLIGFRHHGVRSTTTGLAEPTADQMTRYRETFARRGLFRLCVS